MLLLDERIRADGSHARCYASAAGDRLHIHDDEANGELSVAAVDRVMTRYGRALDPAIDLAGNEGESLELAGGYRLKRLRYHTPVDATGRDYLVWEKPGSEPLCVVATMVTAALRYLVLRLGGEHSQESEG